MVILAAFRHFLVPSCQITRVYVEEWPRTDLILKDGFCAKRQKVTIQACFMGSLGQKVKKSDQFDREKWPKVVILHPKVVIFAPFSTRSD